jgi:hypothetical protein
MTIREIHNLKKRSPHLHFYFSNGLLHVERPPKFFYVNTLGGGYGGKD